MYSLVGTQKTPWPSVCLSSDATWMQVQVLSGDTYIQREREEGRGREGRKRKREGKKREGRKGGGEKDRGTGGQGERGNVLAGHTLYTHTHTD